MGPDGMELSPYVCGTLPRKALGCACEGLSSFLSSLFHHFFSVGPLSRGAGGKEGRDVFASWAEGPALNARILQVQFSSQPDLCPSLPYSIELRTILQIASVPSTMRRVRVALERVPREDGVPARRKLWTERVQKERNRNSKKKKIKKLKKIEKIEKKKNQKKTENQQKVKNRKKSECLGACSWKFASVGTLTLLKKLSTLVFALRVHIHGRCTTPLVLFS